MKTKLLLATLFIATAGYGQKNKVVSAYNYINTNELDKAKEAIDLATEHETTKEFWKTYYYRGEVYYNLALTQNENFKGLAEKPLIESFKAYSRVYELGDNKVEKNELDRRYRDLIPPAFNFGVNAFNEGKYSDAIEYFGISKAVSAKFNQVDSLSTYNMALASDRANDAASADKYYRECIAINYKPEMMYLDLANFYLRAENEVQALQVLAEGRQKFPNDQNLLTTELNIYLKNEKFDEALQNLNVAIANDPGNHIFYYARGTILNNKGDMDKALTDYKKCIELKSDFFDGYYNLGAVYFNRAVELNNDANAVPANQPKVYEEKRDIAVKAFAEARPYLEKAHELNPEDVPTMQSLKQLYIITKDNEKFKMMNDKLQGK